MTENAKRHRAFAAGNLQSLGAMCLVLTTSASGRLPAHDVWLPVLIGVVLLGLSLAIWRRSR